MLLFEVEMKDDGLLAQAVEHLTFNQGVAGSSPAWLRMICHGEGIHRGFCVITGCKERDKGEV